MKDSSGAKKGGGNSGRDGKTLTRLPTKKLQNVKGRQLGKSRGK
tara:strand:- start:2730 stop:2861 length:132 start_codon:yes stop_codon:yes gene_type:complete